MGPWTVLSSNEILSRLLCGAGAVLFYTHVCSVLYRYWQSVGAAMKSIWHPGKGNSTQAP
jgi:hypothetical protein